MNTHAIFFLDDYFMALKVLKSKSPFSRVWHRVTRDNPMAHAIHHKGGVILFWQEFSYKVCASVRMHVYYCVGVHISIHSHLLAYTSKTQV